MFGNVQSVYENVIKKFKLLMTTAPVDRLLY
jgi:hypothetical protein